LNISDKLIKLKAQKQLLDEQQNLNEKIKTLKRSTNDESERHIKSIDEIICTPSRWESNEKNSLTGFKEMPKDK